MTHPAPRTSPLPAGLALLVAGLVLRLWQPSVLDMPDRPARHSKDSGLPRAARRARDGVTMIAPGNLTRSLGRTLIVAGAALVAIRALDLLVEDDDALF